MDGKERSAGRRNLRWLGGGAGVVVLSALGVVLAVQQRNPADAEMAVDSTRAEIRRLQGENDLLRMELELAADEGPYLVADLRGMVLRLKSHGAPLREFPLQSASIRTRRLLVAEGESTVALDTVWRGGELHPGVHRERIVILADTVAPPDPSGTVGFIPPTPEEAVPTPPTFRIRFDAGWSVVVRPGTPLPNSSHLDETEAGAQKNDGRSPSGEVRPSLPSRVWAWLRTAPWLLDRLSLHLTLSPADAGALYRAYPDGTPILVVGP